MGIQALVLRIISMHQKLFCDILIITEEQVVKNQPEKSAFHSQPFSGGFFHPTSLCTAWGNLSYIRSVIHCLGSWPSKMQVRTTSFFHCCFYYYYYFFFFCIIATYFFCHIFTLCVLSHKGKTFCRLDRLQILR